MLGDVSKILCIPALVALMPRPWGRWFCETLNVSVYLVLPAWFSGQLHVCSGCTACPHILAAQQQRLQTPAVSAEVTIMVT